MANKENLECICTDSSRDFSTLSIAELAAVVAACENNIRELREDISDIRSDLDEVTSTVENVETRVDEIADEAEEANNIALELIDIANTGKNHNMYNYVDGLTKGKFSVLLSDIDYLKEHIAALDDRLSYLEGRMDNWVRTREFDEEENDTLVLRFFSLHERLSTVERTLDCHEKYDSALPIIMDMLNAISMATPQLKTLFGKDDKHDEQDDLPF